MSKALIAAVVFITNVVVAHSAPSVDLIPDKCIPSMFQTTITDKTLRATSIYLLDLVTRDNYNSVQTQAQASGTSSYGFFSGTFDEFRVKRDQFRQEHEYKFDEKISRNYAITSLDNNGLSAYKSCLDHLYPSNSVIIALEPGTSFDDLITFNITVNRNTSFSQPFAGEVYGARAHQELPRDRFTEVGGRVLIKWPSADVIGSQSYTIRRASPCKEFRVAANYGDLLVHPLVLPAKHRTMNIIRSRLITHSGRMTVHGDLSYSRGHAFLHVTSDHDVNFNDGKGDMDVNSSSQFAARLCLCANEQYDPTNGSCKSPNSEFNSALDVHSIRHSSPPSSCGDEGQPSPRELLVNTAQACYSQTLNTRSTAQGETCDYDWSIAGTLLTAREIFVASGADQGHCN